MQYCSTPPDAEVLRAVVLAFPTPFLVGAALYWSLTWLRRRGRLSRFVARVWIVGGSYMALAWVLRAVGGPCVLAGWTRSGTYNGTPLDGYGILAIGLGAGLLGAALWPLFTKGRPEFDL